MRLRELARGVRHGVVERAAVVRHAPRICQRCERARSRGPAHAWSGRAGVVLRGADVGAELVDAPGEVFDRLRRVRRVALAERLDGVLELVEAVAELGGAVAAAVARAQRLQLAAETVDAVVEARDALVA